MRLYIIRHADPDYANNTITAFGHREAQALAPRLAREGVTRIYSSPLGRAVDTARYTAESLGLDVTIEPWMHELSDMIISTDEGTFAAWDMPGALIRSHPELLGCSEDVAGLPYMGDIPILEALGEIEDGSRALLSSLGYERDGPIYRCEAASRERVALFCHDGFGRVLISQLLGIPLGLLWAGLWLPPSSVTTMLFERRSPNIAVPRCIGFGDTSHLYEAGLPVRPRGITSLDLDWPLPD